MFKQRSIICGAITTVLLAAMVAALSHLAVAGPPDGKGGGKGDGGGAITNPAMVFQAASRKSKSWDIFIRTADGSSELQLTKDDLADAWPAWSPDGKQIAFLRQRAFGAPEFALYVMNADGTGLRLVKDFVADQEPLPPDFGSTPFDWSPDGTMIVLNGLYVLNVATGQGDYLLGVPDEGDGYQPAWSPDGTMIAFTNYVGDFWLTATGTWDLFVVDLATLVVVNLTPNVGRNSLPAWSPDGGNITFATHLSGPSGGNWELFRVSPTGTGLSNITGTDRSSEAQVDWNPAWIAP